MRDYLRQVSQRPQAQGDIVWLWRSLASIISFARRFPVSSFAVTVVVSYLYKYRQSLENRRRLLEDKETLIKKQKSDLEEREGRFAFQQERFKEKEKHLEEDRLKTQEEVKRQTSMGVEFARVKQKEEWRNEFHGEMKQKQQDFLLLQESYGKLQAQYDEKAGLLKKAKIEFDEVSKMAQERQEYLESIFIVSCRNVLFDIQLQLSSLKQTTDQIDSNIKKNERHTQLAIAYEEKKAAQERNDFAGNVVNQAMDLVKMALVGHGQLSKEILRSLEVTLRNAGMERKETTKSMVRVAEISMEKVGRAVDQQGHTMREMVKSGAQAIEGVAGKMAQQSHESWQIAESGTQAVSKAVKTLAKNLKRPSNNYTLTQNVNSHNKGNKSTSRRQNKQDSSFHSDFNGGPSYYLPSMSDVESQGLFNSGRPGRTPSSGIKIEEELPVDSNENNNHTDASGSVVVPYRPS